MKGSDTITELYKVYRIARVSLDMSPAEALAWAK